MVTCNFFLYCWLAEVKVVIVIIKVGLMLCGTIFNICVAAADSYMHVLKSTCKHLQPSRVRRNWSPTLKVQRNRTSNLFENSHWREKQNFLTGWWNWEDWELECECESSEIWARPARALAWARSMAWNRWNRLAHFFLSIWPLTSAWSLTNPFNARNALLAFKQSIHLSNSG